MWTITHTWKMDQLDAGEMMKLNLYTKGYGDIWWVFLAFVATTLGQLAPDLLCYLLFCAG